MIVTRISSDKRSVERAQCFVDHAGAVVERHDANLAGRDPIWPLLAWRVAEMLRPRHRDRGWRTVIELQTVVRLA